MNIAQSAMMIMVGFMVGALLASFVARWAALVIETLKGPSAHPRRMAALVSLFHAGPWLLVAVAIFGFFEYSERWAQLVGVGIIVYAVFIAYFMYRLRAKARENRAEKQNAA